MLEACEISELTRSSEHHLFPRDCSESPEPTDLENTLEDVFTDNAIENITFKQWILTDRCCKELPLCWHSKVFIVACNIL
jgi:hypothetical protein